MFRPDRSRPGLSRRVLLISLRALAFLAAPVVSHAQFLDTGPFWEIQNLPTVSDTNIGLLPVVFLNADRRPEVLLAYSPYSTVSPTPGPVLFLNNMGNRVFVPIKPSQPAMMIWPRNSTVADFDGDGLEDVLVADTGFDAPPFPGGVTRLFMQRSGSMIDETDSRLPPGVAFTHDVCSADVNLDGSPDIVFVNLRGPSNPGGPQLRLNDGRGHFKTANELLPPIFSTSFGPIYASCQFVDVNRDGAPDLLLGSNNPQVGDSLLLNDGRGNLRDVTAASMPLKRGGPTWNTMGFAQADINRDGWPDLIATIQSPAGTMMQLSINNRDGTFHEQDDAALNAIRTTGGRYFEKPYALDLNQDGWPDVMVNQSGFGARLFQNVGGHFEERTDTLPPGSYMPVPADFDGDGRIDIALFNGNRIRIGWGRNLWAAVAVNTPIVTSASMAGGFPGIVQNGWIEIKGTHLVSENIGPNGMTWETAGDFASGRMPEQLGGASVTVNGKPAFIYYVSPTQLNVLTPIDSALGTVQIVVTSGGLSSAPFSANMVAAAPSFPLYGSPGYLVSQHSADYTLVGPVSLSASGYPVTPAKPGETIVVYAFGFGLPTTTLVNGSVTQSGVLPTLPVIQIGGLSAAVKFAGVISPGLYMFNVVVPGTAPNGDNLVTCTYNGSTAPTGGLIFVQR